MWVLFKAKDRTVAVNLSVTVAIAAMVDLRPDGRYGPSLLLIMPDRTWEVTLEGAYDDFHQAMEAAIALIRHLVTKAEVAHVPYEEVTMR